MWGEQIAAESVVPRAGLSLQGSWRVRKEGDKRMRSSAQPLTSGRWQLLFIPYPLKLARPGVLHAIPCPSLSGQVIWEHRLHSYQHFLFLYVYDRNGDRKSKEVTVWKQVRTLA